MPSSASALDYFGMPQQGTDVGTEVRAGVATFMVMSYIIFVICVLTFRRGIVGELARILRKPL